MYTDPTGHYEYTDFLYLPNDALVQIDKYTNDYYDTFYNYLPGDVKFKSKALNEQKAHQNANAVRTYYANYYPRDTEEFAKYYKIYESADCGWVFFPKYKSSSRLLRLPSGEEITADNIDKLANDPKVRKYFLDNYITNTSQPAETLYKMWFHQFYGYTKKEIKQAKFRNGLENIFFGAVETGTGALSVAYSAGAMAYVGGGYATIDGLNRMSGGLSQVLNSGNDKGETWNFKKNFYNFISPEYGDKLYFADQMLGVAIGLYDIGAIVYGKAASKIGNLSSKEVAINSFYKGTRNIPQGLTSEQFSNASKLIRQKVGDISDDIVVQGSRAGGTAKATSDIDFAIRVSPEQFDDLVKQKFGTPNVGSAKERTMLNAIKTGKIQSGEAGLRGLRKQLQEMLGIDVDISIIKSGGPFDSGPTIELPK
jgi:hypothetical protein